MKKVDSLNSNLIRPSGKKEIEDKKVFNSQTEHGQSHTYSIALYKGRKWSGTTLACSNPDRHGTSYGHKTFKLEKKVSRQPK